MNMIPRAMFLGLVAWLVCTALLRRTIAGDLNEQEAQEIVVLLNKSGIVAALQCVDSKKKNAPKVCSIEIQGGDRTEALARGILQDSGLPRKRELGLTDSIQANSVLSTPEEAKANSLARLCGELNQMLKEFPGVVVAHVVVVIPEMVPSRPKVPPSASVFIKHWAGVPPPDDSEVKLLVARAVEGLSPESVAVVFSKLVPSAPDFGLPWQHLLPGPERVLDYSVPFVAIVLAGLLALRYGPVVARKVGPMAKRPQSVT